MFVWSDFKVFEFMKKSKLSLNYLWIVVFVISYFCFFTFSVFASSLGDDLELQEMKKKMQLLEYDQKYDQKYTNLEKRVGNFFDTEKDELEKLKDEVGNLDKISDDRWNLLDNQVNIFALIVGILSLGVPIFGWIGYKGIKKRVEEELKEASEKISKEMKEINVIKEEAKKYLTEIKKTKDDAKKDYAYLNELANKQKRTYQEEKTLEEAINKAKNDVKELSMMFHLLGYDAVKNKDYEQAIKYYTKAIELDKNNTKVYNNRGVAFSNLAGLKTGKEKKELLEKSINDYREDMKISKNEPESYGNLAEVFFVMNKEKEAEPYLKKALDISSKESNKDNFLGFCFYEYAFYGDDDKKWRKAKKEIEEMLKDGVRALNFDLNISVQKAWDDEHPDKEDVLRLAEEITGLEYSPEEKSGEEK